MRRRKTCSAGPRHVAFSRQRPESEQDERGDDQGDEEARRQNAHIAQVLDHEAVIGAQFIFGDDLGRVGQQLGYVVGVEGAFVFPSFQLSRLQGAAAALRLFWGRLRRAADDAAAGGASALPSSTAP